MTFKNHKIAQIKYTYLLEKASDMHVCNVHVHFLQVNVFLLYSLQLIPNDIWQMYVSKSQ